MQEFTQLNGESGRPTLRETDTGWLVEQNKSNQTLRPVSPSMAMGCLCSQKKKTGPLCLRASTAFHVRFPHLPRLRSEEDFAPGRSAGSCGASPGEPFGAEGVKEEGGEGEQLDPSL